MKVSAVSGIGLLWAVAIVLAGISGVAGIVGLDRRSATRSDASVVSDAMHEEKISPALRLALATGEERTFLVVLAEQAAVDPATVLPTKQAKGRAVYDTLRSVALRTQPALRAELDAWGVEYRAFYIVNMLAVRGTADLAQVLAAHPDVARLEANPAVRSNLPLPSGQMKQKPAAALGVEWGVQRVGADKVWSLGYDGRGIVVAGQDTGYDWDHPALKAQYRGWDGTTVLHDYHWHDAIHSGGGVCGPDSPEPCDDHGHGTHTMGTMVGDDGGGNQIGVAPGAEWIGCRNMDRGVGTPATYAECFEFFLAPYPVGGDPMTDGEPDLAPHVINNSWSCPPSEGCDQDSLRAVVENVRAAGIAVVASAGNSGSSCSTVAAPPAIHEAVFTVGATDITDQIASFSSRGPVTVDGSNRSKPQVSAPGVSVRSSLRGGGYGWLSGTSMAAPHVAGSIALLWSAAPCLVGDVDRTEWLIQETAHPVSDTTCGGEADGHPNNVYGWGIVNALKAVQYVGLDVSAEVHPDWVQAGSLLTFTFTITNASVSSPATSVVLSDVLPSDTTFFSASGTYSQTQDRILWSLDPISACKQAGINLTVRVADDLPAGTSIANVDYGVRSAQVATPVIGSPTEALIPWRYFLSPLLKNWLW